MSGEPDPGLKSSFFLLMVYAALFGALSSLLTVVYITLYNQGVNFFGQVNLVVFNINIWPLVLLTGAGVFIGLLIKFFGQHEGLGVAQREYAQTGHLNYKNLPNIMLQAFITLWSGAAVGPEAPLTALSGGVGSFVADRLKLQKEDIEVLVYSSIAGAFGGFFGSPIIGAVGAVEYMFIRELNLYRHLIPGLLAAAVGFGVYGLILGSNFQGIYSFPDYPSLELGDLWWALLVGLIAGVIGIMYKLLFGIVNLVFTRLNMRPVVLAIIGGVVIGLIGTLLPLTLYSGQDQLLQIIHNPAAYGIGILLLLLLAKTVMTSASFATGFVAGPIFPLLFIGGTLGLAISKILTFIPEGVAVTAAMAGVTCAVFPLPVTIILLLGLLGGQSDLLPGIAVGAVVGLLVSKALTPLLPNRGAKSGGEKSQTN
jgi:H+/Cl- antiporter ClcA